MSQPLEIVTAGLAMFAFSRLGMPVTVLTAATPKESMESNDSAHGD